jgi:hypothetical protein
MKKTGQKEPHKHPKVTPYKGARSPKVQPGRNRKFGPDPDQSTAEGRK